MNGRTLIIMILVLLFAGIALLSLSFIQIDSKLRVEEAPLPIFLGTDVKFHSDNSTIVSFNVPPPNMSSYKLRVDIQPLDYKLGPVVQTAVVYMIMVDDDGLDRIRNNQTPSYIYMSVEGLDHSRSFTLRNLSEGKSLHMLFTSPLPVDQHARVSVIQFHTLGPYPLGPLEISGLGAGITLIAASVVLLVRKKGKRRGQ
jgi:hypothetical protein